MRLREVKVGCIGGGTGLPSLLGGLKSNPWLQVNAVVTMFDSGGSSGILRDQRCRLVGVLIGERGRRPVVVEELAAVKDTWRVYLSSYRVETPDANLNAMINTWNQYQCKTTFDWSRYISFYENGEGRGMGTRDSSQDTLAVCVQMPEQVHAREDGASRPN